VQPCASRQCQAWLLLLPLPVLLLLLLLLLLLFVVLLPPAACFEGLECLDAAARCS
jgi:hypothetical protein